jgi:DNA-binding NtrC family response regulator
MENVMKLSRKEVLILDNLRFISNTTLSILNKAGIGGLIVGNAKEALSAAAKKKYSAVLINPDAFQSREEIDDFKKNVKIPYILSMGIVLNEDAERLLKLFGTRDWVFKPFDDKSLLEAVQRVIKK